MRYCALLVLILSLFACDGKRKAMICKTWQVSDVQFINENEATVQTDTMKGNQIEVTKFQLRDILMRNIYEFKDDGTYKTGNPAGSSEGNWELDGNSILFIQESEGVTKEKKIKMDKLENDSLILLMQNDQTSLQIKLVMTPLSR